MQKVELSSDSFGPCNAFPTSLVVLLHGRGDTGRNLVGLAVQLSKRLPGTRFLLPTAPPGPHGLNSWYETDHTGNLDERIYELHRQLMQQIQFDCQKFSLELAQVAFLGFSQGSMLAGLAALQLSRPCAGLIVLCGGVPWHLDVTDALSQTPILFVSGKCDRTATVYTTRMAQERLLELGAQQLRYLELPDLNHEISPKVVELVADFLWAALPQSKDQSIRIPDGMKVSLYSAGYEARTGAIDGFVQSEDKYWVQMDGPDGHRELIESGAFTQQLHTTLAGQSAILVGKRLADDGCIESLSVAVSEPSAEVLETKQIAPHRVQLPVGAVLQLGGMKKCAKRLQCLDGRRVRLRQVLQDGRYAVEVQGEEALVRVHPRHLVP